MPNIKINHRLFQFMAGMFCLLSVIDMEAQQEPMFTQYIFNETFINPAYAGSHDGLSMSMRYRNQWTGFNGSPKTQSFSMHMPVNKRKVGIGLSVLNETIGVTKQLMVNADFSYRIIMPQSVLSFGLKGGFVNHEENFSLVHTTTSGDIQFANDVRKYFLPNAGFGIYYSFENKFYAGFSIPRLLENKIDPSQSNDVVSAMGNPEVWHYYFTSGYVIDLGEKTKFKPATMIRCVQNVPIELEASMNFLFNDFLWLGGSYRTGDAVTCLLGFQLSKNLRMSYSYDYTLTELQKYNSGSHEFTLSYEIGIYNTRIVSLRYF